MNPKKFLHNTALSAQLPCLATQTLFKPFSKYSPCNLIIVIIFVVLLSTTSFYSILTRTEDKLEIN